MKLLIVDDNSIMRKFIRETFKDRFSELVECTDGMYSLDEFEKLRPEWVFMDIKMKFLDGIEATRLIVSKYPSARIIIVTEYDNDKLKAKAIEAGASFYVTKDNISEIFNLIHN